MTFRRTIQITGDPALWHKIGVLDTASQELIEDVKRIDLEVRVGEPTQAMLYFADGSTEWCVVEIRERPEVVCICGSARFKDQIVEAYGRLTDEGKIVLSLGRFIPHEEQKHQQERKAALDELHLRKIDLADTVFVVNVDGYVGESTSREIAYARAMGKPVVYLEETES